MRSGGQQSGQVSQLITFQSMQSTEDTRSSPRDKVTAGASP